MRTDVRDPNASPIAADKFGKAAEIFGGTVTADRQGAPARPRDDGQAQGVVRLPEAPGGLPEARSPTSCAWATTIKAQRLTARFIHNGNLANNVTLAFGFDYCSFKFSRYGF